MNVIYYKNDENLINQYFALVSSKYSSLKNFEYFFSDLKEAVRFSLSNQQTDFLAIMEGEKMIAHIALILDPQLPEGKAFWGFFESQNNEEIFTLLWEKLKELAKEKGFNQLLGPINGSVWHQYRFIKETDTSPFFKTELFCEPFYYDLVKKIYSKEILYYSACRNDFNKLISITESFYNKMTDDGFTIIESTEVTEKQLKDVLNLCKTVFKSSWGYIDISDTDFASLYSSQKFSDHLSKVYFLQKDQKVIGYCSILLEDSDSLILKTIAILPEFQSFGLGNALIHKIHIDAQKNQCKKIIYALIREDNGVKRLPKDDAVIFRRYVAFESNI